MKTPRDFTNKKIGKLLVLERGPDRVKSDGKSQIQWKCQCECGNVVYRIPHHLTRGNCACKDCINEKNSKKWKLIGDLNIGVWGYLKSQAKSRKIVFKLSPKYVWELFLAQGKKCALSGLPLEFAKTKKDKTKTTASIDRIDSARGYVRGNVQWVHKDINYMKLDLNQRQFVEYCSLVANYFAPSCLAASGPPK